ncbi:MAG: sarcosine oxidase subunit gamma family protein [Pseudomonadota bacterium]
MSDAVSPLDGASFDGLVKLRDMGPTGMLTVRGTLDDTKFGAALLKATGVELPGKLRILGTADMRIAWMSPDELLVICPYAQAAKMSRALSDALSDQHALVVNVSDTRVALSVEGAATREVLAKLTPVDVAPDAMPAGTIRRTRLAQVPAAFWFDADGNATVIAFRSVAAYVFDLLQSAAHPDSAVAYF